MTLLEQETFAQWNQCMAAIAATQDPEKFPELLMTALNTLINVDMRTILIFGPNRKPVSLCEETNDAWPEEDMAYYLTGAFLLDPYYRAGINGIEAGLYRMKDVAPGAFQDSEYYKNYYHASAIEGELGYIIYLADGCFANLALNRTSTSAPFSNTEVERLRAALPVVESLLAKYWDSADSDKGRSGSDLYVQLEQALDVFGTSLLTPREAEVMRMYLYGHDTRSISERLNISPHTVSAHRKHAYARLDITSQAELFSLFINSMYCFDGNPETDPLENYLRVPSPAD
jgi:DNA-binding CsgD family transcriptional regulator